MDAASFLDRVVGRTISAKRLAANSLLLYLDGGSDDLAEAVVWLEPTWHIVGRDAVLAGSRQAQHDHGLRAISDVLDVIVGRTITSIRAEPITNDLVIGVDGGFTLRTFVADVTDDETWHVRDRVTGRTLYGAPGGLTLA